MRKAVSQETCPRHSWLTLFARKGVALRPIPFRGAFLLAEKMRRRLRTGKLLTPRSTRVLGIRIAVAALALIPAVALAMATHGWTQAGVPKPASSEVQPLEITDETGRHVRVPQPVRRIVSLAPSLTETLYALAAQDHLVGVTNYCDYPPEAQRKPKVGGTINPNLEEVVALKPDLVVVTKTANRKETVEALERLSVAVYATDPRSVEDVLASTRQLADLIGAHEQGKSLVAALGERLQELKRVLAGRPPRRVLFVVWQDPLISVGRGTFLGDALRWAGAETVVSSTQDWPRMSLEEAVHLQPEYLVFASSHAEQVKRNFHELRERPGWRDLEAVRERRIAVVSDAVNRPAPRLIDAIEQLARQLHPDAFEANLKKRNSKPETRSPGGFETAAQQEACTCAR